MSDAMPSFFAYAVVRRKDGAWVAGSRITLRKPPRNVGPAFKVVRVRICEAYIGADRNGLEGAEQRYLDKLIAP